MILLAFQGSTSFVDHLCFFCLLLCIYARLIICALWSPTGKGLASRLLFVVTHCKFVTFSLVGILGQVWYLMVSIPDLGTLAYFDVLSDRVHLIHNFLPIPVCTVEQDPLVIYKNRLEYKNLSLV